MHSRTPQKRTPITACVTGGIVVLSRVIKLYFVSQKVFADVNICKPFIHIEWFFSVLLRYNKGRRI